MSSTAYGCLLDDLACHPEIGWQVNQNQQEHWIIIDYNQNN